MKKIWIYKDGAQKGPFTIIELFDLGTVDANTPVWFEGMEKWLKASEVAEFGPFLQGDRDHYLADAPKEEPVDVAETPHAEVEAKVERIEEVAEPVSEVSVQVETAASRYAPGRRAPRRTDRPDEPCPPTYLGWSIFLTICCCSPVALAGIVASIFVSVYYNRGRLDASRHASEVAAWLIMVAIALGFLPGLFMSSIL